MLNALDFIVKMAYLGIILAIVVVSYILCIVFFDQETIIESKTIIVPEIKLVTNGNVIDTVYIYKHKN